MYTQPYTYTQQIPLSLDDGHGDYNRSYERSDDDFDYADYSTDHRDNNFRNYEKKRRKTNKEIIEDIIYLMLFCNYKECRPLSVALRSTALPEESLFLPYW